jgi:replication factor A1
MALLESSEKIIQTICSKTSKTEQEVKALIKEKKEKFAGLLTESGAAFMVAKELNVDLDVKKEISESLKVSQLEEGMNNVDLTVRVLQVFSPKKFEKKGKKGSYVRILVGDDSGEIMLTLWHQDVELVQQHVKRNDVLELKNCFVSSFGEKKQLGIGKGGSWKVIEGKEKGLPKARNLTVKLKDLKPEAKDFDVIARVVRVFEEKSFEVKERKGKVLNFELADETALVRGVAWNELVKEVKKIMPGEIIKIEGAQCKKGLKGMELHLNWRSRITKNPFLSFSIPSLQELLGKEFKSKKLGELTPGMKDVEVRATIVDLAEKRPFFFVCPRCFGKLQQTDEMFSCIKCGEVKEPEVRLVASMQLDDGFEVMQAVAFGNNAENILGIDQEKIKERIKENRIKETVKELKEKVKGRELVFRGRVKEGLNQKAELLVEGIQEVEPKKEVERLLKEADN